MTYTYFLPHHVVVDDGLLCLRVCADEGEEVSLVYARLEVSRNPDWHLLTVTSCRAQKHLFRRKF